MKNRIKKITIAVALAMGLGMSAKAGNSILSQARIVGGSGSVPTWVADGATTNLLAKFDATAGKDLALAFTAQNVTTATTTVTIDLREGVDGSTNVMALQTWVVSLATPATTNVTYCTNLSDVNGKCGGMPYIYVWSVGCSGGSITNWSVSSFNK